MSEEVDYIIKASQLRSFVEDDTLGADFFDYILSYGFTPERAFLETAVGFNKSVIRVRTQCIWYLELKTGNGKSELNSLFGYLFALGANRLEGLGLGLDKTVAVNSISELASHVWPLEQLESWLISLNEESFYDDIAADDLELLFKLRELMVEALERNWGMTSSGESGLELDVHQLILGNLDEALRFLTEDHATVHHFLRYLELREPELELWRIPLTLLGNLAYRQNVRHRLKSEDELNQLSFFGGYQQDIEALGTRERAAWRGDETLLIRESFEQLLTLFSQDWDARRKKLLEGDCAE